MRPVGEIVDAICARLQPALAARGAVTLPDLPAAARAVVAWSLQRVHGGPVVWVADGAATLEELHRDVVTLCPLDELAEGSLLYFPEWESMPTDERGVDPEIVGQRLSVLTALAAYGTQARVPPGSGDAPPVSRPPLVLTCVQALMQATASPSEPSRLWRRLAVGEEHEFDALVAHLAGAGYSRAPEVDAKGRFSLKGGVLDFWPVTEAWPLRVEFFGAAVESIRAFDPVDQRSRGRQESVTIPPVSETGAAARGAGTESAAISWFTDHIPAGALVVWCDPAGIEEHAATLEEACRAEGGEAAVCTWQELRARVRSLPGAREVRIGEFGRAAAPAVPLDFVAVQEVSALPRDVFQPDFVESLRQKVFADLGSKLASGWRVFVYFDTPSSLEHYRARLPAAAEGLLTLGIGTLSGGFSSAALQVAVAGEVDFVGRRKIMLGRYDPQGGRRTRPRRASGERVADLADLESGDLVVHAEHGVGRYLGLSEIVFSGQSQEVLTIEYDEGAKLHVPVSHAHLLSRYVGLSGQRPNLHRLGGRRWDKEKQEAQQAIQDLAAALLETQAARRVQEGLAFPADTPWQRDFELAFPYEETADQAAAIADVKRDQEAARPMDRLVCGDAGYGKTEVAMRAAFKVVADGRQVAVLVPTTVLAQQHYETFAERMAGYPFRIEMLSRFAARGRRGTILRGLREGTVDIVIGTHALVQEGIEFARLGLVIIDEEQRFGVVHKERLKNVCRTVDVLTLTATPIPRTLYMSMTGARDMSLIQTPPRERMAVETIVARNGDDVVRKAILRELNREGQAFYLHNRVLTIGMARDRLARLVPQARLAVAHGQMAGGELAAVMHAFVRGEFDVLVCTTIIESGLDIPRVNTILIDRADRFGIADLYQLRGRVGRSSHKAYAYLLLPPSGPVDADARRRISALKKHASLGAGFNLALKDLEIRGAGNLLGQQQSGHIAAIGFSLYCQLLRRTVAQMRGERPPRVVDAEVLLDFLALTPSAPGDAAAIPFEYIEEEGLRIAMYNKLAQCSERKDVEALRAEFVDRFGRLPRPVERLLRVAELRVAAAEHAVQRIETREGKVRLFRGGDYVMRERAFPRLTGRDADENLAQLLRLVETVERWADG